MSDYAPKEVIASRDKVETLDGRVTSLGDEVRACERAIVTEEARAKREAAEALLDGKEPKDIRKAVRALEEKLVDLDARLAAAKEARTTALAEHYKVVRQVRDAWLANMVPAEAEADARIRQALAVLDDALKGKGVVVGVRQFLDFFRDEQDGLTKRQAQLNQRAIRAYWPGWSQARFPNKVKVPANDTITPADLVKFLGRMFEEKQVQVVAPPSSAREASFGIEASNAG